MNKAGISKDVLQRLSAPNVHKINQPPLYQQYEAKRANNDSNEIENIDVTNEDNESEDNSQKSQIIESLKRKKWN